MDQPSTSKGVRGTGRTAPKPSGSKTKQQMTVVCKPKQPQEFTLPAFSVPLPKPAPEQKMEKQKVMRRNKPKGEDLNKLKEIIAGLGNKTISVQEFIALVAPFTGDKGEILQSVLGEEMDNFRNTARKIYETMTEDISDVLTNEHIQLKEHCEERQALLRERTQRKMNAIYALCPDFDFNRYRDEEKYLEEKFPILPAPDMDSEEVQARMRQEAFHRYQWLKSEGERLKQENSRLQKRLGELKKRQKEELQEVADREQLAEDEREVLEEKQEKLETMLDDLTESVGKVLVEGELENAEAVSLKPLPRKSRELKETEQQDWATQQAAEIEANVAVGAASTKSSIVSSKLKAVMKQKKKAKPKKPMEFHFSPIKTPPPKERERQLSPFHYSPPREPPVEERAQFKTPPRQKPQAAAQRSPFHYSPVRSPHPPARKSSSPFHYSPDRAGPSGPPPPAPSPSRVRMTRTTSTTDPQPGPSTSGVPSQRSPSRPQVARRQPEQPQAAFGRRAARGPRDSWGGFN